MAGCKKTGGAGIARRVVGAVLVFALGPPGWAQEVSPALLQAAHAAYQQEQQEEPQILPAAKVDPKLVDKDVLVTCRDGRVYQGRLVELTPESLLLEVHSGAQQLPLSEVATVEPQPSRRKTWKVAVAVAVVATVVTALFAKIVD